MSTFEFGKIMHFMANYGLPDEDRRGKRELWAKSYGSSQLAPGDKVAVTITHERANSGGTRTVQREWLVTEVRGPRDDGYFRDVITYYRRID